MNEYTFLMNSYTLSFAVTYRQTIGADVYFPGLGNIRY